MCKISVIVPVYNTEAYLPRCIDSILGQSLTDFELLLVDDGSPDRCGAICDDYAAKDSRVKVFHKENGGVSSARNLALDNAKGEWITFVDSDDELMSDGLKVLAENISDEVDMVMGGFLECEENGKLISQPLTKRTLLLSKEQSILSLYNGYGPFYFYSGYASFRLYRSQIIKDNNISFYTDIAIKEDTLFVLQYICRSNGTQRITTVPVYKYYHRAGSAMSQVLKGFNYKDVDCFRAFVEMKREIERYFPSYSDVVFVAKQGILSKYYSLLATIKDNGVQDNELEQRLASDTRKEVGNITLYRLRRRFFKIKRTIVK
ncbi:MAG: glycosyltransferase family 2 protein [Bacteroidales bacterium]|nr:glycosyltransferase family 2 protein [Bacteroidales bacterium]